MENTLKDLLYAGVGLAAEASDKVKSEVEKLAEKGKSTDWKAKKVVEDFISKTETKSSDVETKFNEFVSKFGFAKTTEVNELKAKIEKLEQELAANAKTAKATTKTVTQ